jgi:hypothetical protein
MEDVMFFHKSKPIAAGFACAAAAMIIVATANPASAERRNAQDSYCDEQDDCIRYAGVVQKERDGVNYFYGSSDTTLGYPTYQVLRIENSYIPSAAPQEISQPNEVIRYFPYGHSLRPWHKKMKFDPGPFGKSQFRHRNELYLP